MNRSNIVKCVDVKTKQEIYTKFKNKEEKTKTKLAKKYGISTRTLNRILDEMKEGKVKADDMTEAFSRLATATTQLGEAFGNVSIGAVHYSDYDYTITKKQITIIKDGDTRSVIRGYPRFQEIKSSLVNSSFSEESLINAWELLDLPKYIAKFTEGVLTVDHEEGKVWYGTFEIKNSLSDQLIKMLNSGVDVKGFVRFMEKVMENPDKRIVEQLYPFMKHNNITIDSEGYIIGYRAVDENFKDHHTGTMDNSIGTTLKMPRSLVDCNPDATCSTGLHVAAREYAETFGGNTGKLLKVKVDPKNVCSIPVDYDGMKMRCCEFTVLSEVFQ